MKIHGHEFRLATNADVPQLLNLLPKEPSLVYVVDEYNYEAALSLKDFAMGPYWVDEDRQPFVIHGFDRVTLQPAKARIVDNVFQYTNSRFLAWGMSPLSLRLYIPADTPTPV